MRRPATLAARRRDGQAGGGQRHYKTGRQRLRGGQQSYVAALSVPNQANMGNIEQRPGTEKCQSRLGIPHPVFGSHFR